MMVFFFFICASVHGAQFNSMFGSCSTQNPNCFSLIGRGVAWTATTEARLKADLAAGLKTAASAKRGLGAEGHP